MSKASLLLLSTSTIHGSSFMDYCIEEVADHFQGLSEILFVPYAQPSGISLNDYTQLVSKKLNEIGINVKGIHEFEDKKSAINESKGIYIGGGNSFLLLNKLYEYDLVNLISDNVMSGNIKYMGSSAGTNMACQTINNTNDMPIVFPPSFKALNLIPFNINPHYLDPDLNSKHKGETRETRINEFHVQSDIKVVGLREGSWLKVEGDEVKLGGTLNARLFEQGKNAKEISANSDLSFLMD